MPDLTTMTRFTTFAAVLLFTALCFVLMFTWSGWFILPTALFAVLSGMGVYDVNQTKHSILRNYPVLGHMRFFFEGIRPEIRQYLIESDQDEEPFSRDNRSLVYQRAKGQEDARPFGTRERVYDAGYSWVTHSIQPVHIEDFDFWVILAARTARSPIRHRSITSLL